MKKYNLKRKGMAAAALTLAFGMFTPSVSFAAGTPVNVLSGTESQMSSDKEVVYVNNYSAAKRDVNFNDNWKFYLGDASGAEEPAFDDSKWEHVNLPHDYSIEQEYSTKMEAESGYLPGGIGWYRKSFTLGKTAENKRVRIDFGGVYMDATVWVNGTQVGSHPYGYTPFSFDITDLVKFDGENVITVKVNHQTPSSRWYSGSGIYRSVDLNIVNPVHVDLYGTKVETPNLETEKGGAVTTNIKTTVANDSDREQNVTLTHTIFKKGGEPSANIGTVTTETKAIAAGETAAIDATVNAQNPELWSTTNPALYTVRTEVKIGEEVVDTYDTEYGFRYFKFDENSGFSLNGTNMKLKGVCMHHDQGALGAEAWKRAIERQVEILKEMGCNSIRVTHNPAAEELINICNEKGILVVEEMFDGWQNAKNGNNNDYARFFKEWMEKDVRSWIRRDRNHPSVIMWSIGNEIPDTHADAHGQEITRSLLAVVRKWDYRKVAPVTIGSNYMPWENAQKCADIVKVAGYNYAEKYYAEHHEKHPDWIIYGSETSSVVQSRGVYHFPLERANLIEADEQCSALGNSTTSWAAKNTEYCITMDRDTPYSCGQFIWTAIDYIGEPTPYQTKNSYFGQMDTAGFPKDSYYVFRSEWTDGKKDPMIHVYPYWDFNPGQQVDVRITSNAPEVELFVNGASQGKQQIDHQKGTVLQPSWKVPYAPGSICAVAYDETGREIARQERHSFGNTDHYVLKANKSALHADGEDMIFVEISAEDRDGYPVENASDYVRVTVEGAGRLIGLDNGDSTDYDAYKGTVRKLFQGKLLAMIAAKTIPGEIRVTVEDAWTATVSMTDETGAGTATAVVETPDNTAAAGHRTATVTLQAVEAPIRPGVCATEENREYPPAFVDPGFVPVRKLEMSAPYMRLTPEKPYVLLHTRIYPMEATDRKLLWSITDASGIPSPVAKLEELEDGESIRITGVSDGSFQVRCMTCNGTTNIKMISQLDFAVEGMGRTFHSPYEPVAGISYVGSFGGDVSRGVENSAGTDKAQPTGLVYEALDFGEFGSDEITLSIFANDNDPHRIQIWKGEPEESGSGTQGTLVGEITYQKPGIWEVFQPDTFVLPRRLKGVTKLTIVSEDKIFLKEFHFTRQEKAYARLSALTDGVTYGDSFVRTGDAVEQIGNNVSFEFTDMNFGEAGTDSIVICGRTPLQQNTIQLRFTDGATQVLPFPHSEEYRELRFPLERVTGEQNVTFVFLPGCNFDFKWFRFEKSGSEE